MTQKKMRKSTKTLIVMGSIPFELLQNTEHYLKRSSSTRLSALFDDLVDDLIDELHPKLVCNIYGINVSNVTPVKPNFELLRPLFGWAPADTIKRTFAVTITQFAR
jgi:hypothetical protein